MVATIEENTWKLEENTRKLEEIPILQGKDRRVRRQAVAPADNEKQKVDS